MKDNDALARRIAQGDALKRLEQAEVEYKAGPVDWRDKVSRGMLIAGCKGEGELMAHAEKCPVCEGKGTQSVLCAPDGLAGVAELPCHGCGGRGWVTVRDAAGDAPYSVPETTGGAPSIWHRTDQGAAHDG